MYHPETDDEIRYLTTEANNSMNARAFVREVASIDDDTLDELSDDEIAELARQFSTGPLP